MQRKALNLTSILVLGTVLAAQGTFKGGWFQDETLGFKVKVPTKWRQIPTKPDEQWIVGLFQSKREYISRAGYSKKLMMRVIMFDKNAPEKTRQTDKKRGVTRFGRNVLYRNFKDYVKRTQGGGGFFFTVEKDRKKGVPGKMYEVKFEKLAYAKRRVLAWDFTREDVSYAVEFDIYEEHYKKLRSTINKVMKSFKFIESSQQTASGDGESVEIPGSKEWKKMPVSERHKLRQQLEAEQERKLRARLPKDWKVTKTKHFLVISHADAKFTKAIVGMGETCFSWLEKRFGSISDEYVRRSIIRICRDVDEYRAYHGSSGGFGFSISFGSFRRDVSELQFYRGELLRDQWSYFMRNLFSHFLSDKDDDLMDDAPTWVSTGIGYWLNGVVIKGRKVTFAPTIYEKMEMARLKKKGGFRKGSLKTVKELMSMTPKQASELEKAKGEPYYQMGALMRFLEGRGKKSKVFGGKDFLIEYCRASSAAEKEYVKKNGRSGLSGVREATTEEEEEQRESKQRERNKQYSLSSEAKSRAILKDTNAKACDWSDDEWKSLQKGYARSVK